jgi:hypothetical protein
MGRNPGSDDTSFTDIGETVVCERDITFSKKGICAAVVTGACLVVIGGLAGSVYTSEKTAELQLSERKASVLTTEERQNLFEKTIIPAYDLKPGTARRALYQDVCIQGRYNANADEWFPLDTAGIAKTYDLCGWEVKKK